VIEVDRGDFLRLGAGGLMAATAAGLMPAVAGAQLPVATPKDDDEAYVQFATIAERASRDFYRAAADAKGSGFSAAERRHLLRVARDKRAHILRLDALLGPEAPLTEDFVTVLPAGSTATKDKSLQLGRHLETLLVGVYLNGVSFAADPGTRLFLGRLLAFDAQALCWLQLRAGKASPAGMASPVDLEQAAEQLDGFLTTPAFPD